MVQTSFCLGRLLYGFHFLDSSGCTTVSAVADEAHTGWLSLLYLQLLRVVSFRSELSLAVPKPSKSFYPAQLLSGDLRVAAVSSRCSLHLYILLPRQVAMRPSMVTCQMQARYTRCPCGSSTELRLSLSSCDVFQSCVPRMCPSHQRYCSCLGHHQLA